METRRDEGTHQTPARRQLKILRAVEHLPSNPLPAGVRKLVGAQHTYRLREGDYRIIYTITASALLIEIIRIGHRKDVYDRLS